MEYYPGNQDVSLKVCLLQPPDTVEVGGRAFGILPLWLIDILIPSHVEKITSDFFQGLSEDQTRTRVSLNPQEKCIAKRIKIK
ncbi:MAG: hypothetical protein WBM69_12700 [Desulfobacterales bacterium]